MNALAKPFIFDTLVAGAISHFLMALTKDVSLVNNVTCHMPIRGGMISVLLFSRCFIFHENIVIV